MDRHTKIVLWIIAVGVWVIAGYIAGYSDHGRTLRVLDNMDGNIAWTNTYLIKANGRLEDIRVELRSISDQLARQKR
jgi:hypothetical protein